MRTLHIADTTLFFAPHSGGVKRYLLEKNRCLNAMPGIRHSLLVPGERTGWIAPGIRQVRAPCPPFTGGYRLPWRLRDWSNELCTIAPDLIEAGDPYQLAWSALAASDRLGIPAVAFAHSNLARLLGTRFGKIVKAAADYYVHRLYARFDLVLAPSVALAAELRDTGVERVEQQPLGVDGTLFHPRLRDPSLRDRLGLPRDTRLLAFAGRIASEKRIPLLREVVDRLGPPYHLLLIGGVRHGRSSRNVTELAYQSDPQSVARLLASADALLHVGAHETFGLVVLETMACGRPVVAIGAGAIAELVDENAGSLAHTDTAPAIAEAVRALYDRDLDALGASARHRVEQHYTWDQIFAQQLGRYVRLTHGAAAIPLAATQAP
jgi:alpha-1,6-mannosyltransferase